MNVAGTNIKAQLTLINFLYLFIKNFKTILFKTFGIMLAITNTSFHLFKRMQLFPSL